MDDMATLLVRVEAASADVAAKALDDLAASSSRAEAATEKLGSGTRAAMGGLSAIPASLQQIEARTESLRSAVDPLYAAQQRLNAQMAEADNLFRMGALGAEEYQRTVGILDNKLLAISRAQDTLATAGARSAAGTKLATHEAANLGRQLADVGVMLGSGQNPFMTLIQQGPQIADIMHTSGLGARGLAKEVGLMLGILRAVPATNAAVAASSVAVVAGNEAIAASATTAAAAEAVALAPLGIILAGLAVVAATFAVGLGVTAQQIDKTGHSASDLQKKLGLTEAQMKRLKKEGNDLGVTMGDVLVGTFDFAGKKLSEAFHWEDLKKGVGEFYQAAVDWTVSGIRVMVGAWGGLQGGLRAMFAALPAAIGEATIGAANLAIRAINWLIESGRDKINGLIDVINLIGGLTLNLPPIPHLPDGKIKELANQYAGAGDKLGSAYSDGFKKGSAEALAGLDKEVADWLAAIDAAWAKRNKKGAGEAGASPKGKADSVSDFDRLMNDIGLQAVTTNAATKAQLEWNAAVASGTMTADEATRARDWAIERAGIEAKADKLNTTQKGILKEALDALAVSYANANAAKLTGDTIGANVSQERQIADLEKQIGLIGKLGRAREVELARWRAEQDAKASGLWNAAQSPTDEGRAAAEAMQRNIANAEKIAGLTYDLNAGQQAYNDALSETARLWQGIGDTIGSAADKLAGAGQGYSKQFAGIVQGIGGVVRAFSTLNVREDAISKDREKRSDEAAGDTVKLKLIAAQSARAMREAQVAAYGDMAAAGKSFFEEGSAGYQIMEKAETAFRAIQFAMSIRAMVQNAAEKEAGMKLSFKAAIANTIEGVSKAFGQMGVYGFIGAAAILGTMAALGIAAGSAGSGNDKAINAGQNQERQGTGGILGDSSAKSESIAKALDLVAEHTNDQLEYSNGMLRALKGIENNISAVAAALARALSIGGALDEKAVKGLGSMKIDRGTSPSAWSAIFAPGGFDPAGLFSGTITKKLVDQGLQFAGQSLSDIMAGGLNARYFQTIETRQKEKAFGVTVKDTLKNKTTFSEVDEDLKRQLTLIVGSLRDGVLAAASVLGLQGADATLNAFNLTIGQISLKGLKGQEITDALNAVFSKLGDDMAGAVLPGLTSLQRVGEGLFETLVRVARQYQVVDTSLAAIGKTFGTVGMSSLAARERLINLFGSLDDFVEQTSYYAETFLTEAERLAPVQSALTAELARLGIVGLDTRDEFKALVQGLDLSSAAGAELFAALMAIAPAFAAITEETEAVTNAKDALADAYGRERDQLQGTIDELGQVFSGLGKYRSSLYSGPTAALSPEAAYQAAKAEFARVNGLAATGDRNALGDLQNVSQAYLDASRSYYASSQGYFADLQAVRDAVTAAEGIAGAQVDVAQQQLDALTAQVGQLIDLNENVVTVAEAIVTLTALLGNGATTPVVITGNSATDQTAVVSQLQQTNATLQQTNATLAELAQNQEASRRQQSAINDAQAARDARLEEQMRTVTQRMQEAAA